MVLVLALSGCIEIEDVGGYWRRGSVDPALEGKWLLTPARKGSSQSEIYVVFTKGDGQYEVTTIEISDLKIKKNEGPMKTFAFRGHSFGLIMPPEKSPAATLWPYTVEADGMLRVYDVPEGLGKMAIRTLDDASMVNLVRNIEGPPAWTLLLTGIKVPDPAQ